MFSIALGTNLNLTASKEYHTALIYNKYSVCLTSPRDLSCLGVIVFSDYGDVEIHVQVPEVGTF